MAARKLTKREKEIVEYITWRMNYADNSIENATQIKHITWLEGYYVAMKDILDYITTDPKKISRIKNDKK